MRKLKIIRDARQRCIGAFNGAAIAIFLFTVYWPIGWGFLIGGWIFEWLTEERSEERSEKENDS